MENESSKSSSSSKKVLTLTVNAQQLSNAMQFLEYLKRLMEEKKHAKEMLDAYIKSGKREHLSLTVPKFLDECAAKDEFDRLSEDEVRIVGSEWLLGAKKYNATKHKDKAGRLFLSLVAGYPLGVAVFEIDYSFRLSNADSSKDIRKTGKDTVKFATGSKCVVQLLLQEIEFKDLVDPNGGFVREDGSIHMELDFTIVQAEVKGDDDAGQASSSNASKQDEQEEEEDAPSSSKKRRVE